LYTDIPECEQNVGRFLVRYAPVLSSDSSKLLVPGSAGTWIADFQIGYLNRLLSQPVSATWHPQRAEIAYVLGETLYTWAVGTEPEPTARFQHAGLIPQFARWSPDGHWIAVASLDTAPASGQETNTFWVVSATGEEVINLGSYPAPGMQVDPEGIRWSPDSRAIAVYSGWVLAVEGTARHLDSLEALDWWPPAQARQLIESQEDSRWAFSHNGRRLAFTRENSSQTEVWIAEKETRERFKVAAIPTVYPNAVRWTPDDQALLIGAYQSDGSSTQVLSSIIWTIPVMSEGSIEVLLDDAMLVDVIRLSVLDQSNGDICHSNSVTACSAATEKTQATVQLDNETPLLLQAEDLAEFGSVNLTTSERNFTEQERSSGPGALVGWEEARLTSMTVRPLNPAGKKALIISQSYTFSSPEMARSALYAVQDPEGAFSWVSPGDKSSFDPDLVQLLENHSDSWRAQQGIDSEGLPAYTLWFQSDVYVAEVHIAVGPNQESLGQRLLNHIVERLIDKK
jgi:hypothetical protein